MSMREAYGDHDSNRRRAAQHRPIIDRHAERCLAGRLRDDRVSAVQGARDSMGSGGEVRHRDVAALIEFVREKRMGLGSDRWPSTLM